MTWLTIDRAYNDSRSASRRSAKAQAPDDYVSYVALADGQVVAVPHANLAAAKELLAMQKAALRRVEAARIKASRTRKEERTGELELVR